MNKPAAPPRRPGPSLLLIHGWGMNPAIWGSMADHLRRDFEVHCLALPGHGGAPLIPGWSVASLARSWLEAWPDALWVGWSLGAQIALAAACGTAGRIRGAVLLGGTPRFVAAGDWPGAMGTDVFRAFCARCGADPDATLQQFLGLQVLGSDRRAATLRSLRECLADAPENSRRALLHGLHVLQETDLRQGLGAARCPVLWMSGEADQLTPVDAAHWSAARMPHARVESLPGAGHALFISHENEVLARAGEWLLEECA